MEWFLPPLSYVVKEIISYDEAYLALLLTLSKLKKHAIVLLASSIDWQQEDAQVGGIRQEGGGRKPEGTQTE